MEAGGAVDQMSSVCKVLGDVVGASRAGVFRVCEAGGIR